MSPQSVSQTLTQQCLKHTTANGLWERGILENSTTSSLLLTPLPTCSTLSGFSTAAGLPFPLDDGQAARPCRPAPRTKGSEEPGAARPAAPPAHGHPLFHGCPVCVPGVSEDSPGALTLSGWHGLTFPEDAVHAVQGVRIAGRSERGRRQGRSFPSAPAAPPPRPGSCSSRGRSPGPSAPGTAPHSSVQPRCRCSAAPPRPHRPRTGEPGTSRPLRSAPAPTHLRRWAGGCFTSFCILQGRARGERGPLPCCPPGTGDPGRACPCSGQRAGPQQMGHVVCLQRDKKAASSHTPPAGHERGWGWGCH